MHLATEHMWHEAWGSVTRSTEWESGRRGRDWSTYRQRAVCRMELVPRLCLAAMGAAAPCGLVASIVTTGVSKVGLQGDPRCGVLEARDAEAWELFQGHCGRLRHAPAYR